MIEDISLREANTAWKRVYKHIETEHSAYLRKLSEVNTP